MVKDKIDYIQEYNSIKDGFLVFFCGKGYELEPGVSIASKVDPSVFLVGSCTNVFKQRVFGDSISYSGHALVQPAINSKYFPDFNVDSIGKFVSTYTVLGLLHRKENLYQIISDQYNFFTDVVGLDMKNISIKANESDADLCGSIRGFSNKVIVQGDACRNFFGKHNGIPLLGRNIRFYYNNNNICVLSIYRYQDKDVGVESSATVQGLLMEKYSLKNTMCLSPLNDIKVANTSLELKYYDCITAVSELLHAGVVPNSSHMSGRILKKYIKQLYTISNNENDFIGLIKYYLAAIYPKHNMDIETVVKGAFIKCR